MNITRGPMKTAKKVGIYGPEGVGKTSFAARFPGAVFIDTEGSTRCLAPAEGAVWNTVKKRAVLPIPYGTTSFTMSVNGGTVTEVDTGLNGAQGWYALKPNTDDSVSLSLVAGGINYAATLLGQGDGFFVIIQ